MTGQLEFEVSSTVTIHGPDGKEGAENECYMWISMSKMTLFSVK